MPNAARYGSDQTKNYDSEGNLEKLTLTDDLKINDGINVYIDIVPRNNSLPTWIPKF